MLKLVTVVGYCGILNIFGEFCGSTWAGEHKILFNSVSYHSDLRIPHTCSWCQKLDKRSSRFVVILGLKSKILKVTTLFEWRRWRKCQKSWLLLEGELMKTFWTRLINQCRWINMILILKGCVWPGGCYWKSGSGQWEVSTRYSWKLGIVQCGCWQHWHVKFFAFITYLQIILN